MKLFQMKYSQCLHILIITCITTTHGGQTTSGPLLLYSTNKEIRLANTTRNSNNKIVSTTLLKNFTEGPAIDYHYGQQKLCWTNPYLESILCDSFDGVETKNSVEVILSTGIESPAGLSCDWFTNKLYWTDTETKHIEVTSMENSLHRKTLFWTDIDQPRAIALAPMKGLMFWTDWGEIPKIERAGMNGDSKTREVIVNTNIFWPNGLTIDYESELIYWIDGNLRFLEVMTYEGKNRTTLLHKTGFEYPFGLTMFQKKLFWTDWKTWSIHSFEQGANISKEIIHLTDSIPMYIQVYERRRQPKQSHPCEKNNGGCSHMCLLSPNRPGYSCACPVGIKLVNDLTCAQGPEQLLLLARRTDIYLIYLDSPEYTHITLPLNDVKYTIGVDFDPVDRYIYWSDDEVKKIQRARLNGSDQQDVVTTEIEHPDGIAVDWVARNIYWTDAGTDRLEVCTLNEKYRRVIILDDLIEPRAIAVAPELGWLFWSDWYEKSPKVERANLDGSERMKIVDTDLGWPNGITLDLEKQMLYWCDAKLDRIEYCYMNGSSRKILINDNVPHVFGFTLMGDFLYFTDWQRRSIDRAHKDTGGHREVILDQVPNVMGLKAINLGAVSGNNLCRISNGGCTQFCFYRHNNTKICACELGYELASDGRTCTKPDIFLLYTKRTQIGMIGIENPNNEIAMPITGINNCSSIDYDINSMCVYWSDSASRTIMRAFLNGSNPQKVVDLGLASPEAIAVDWLGLNIYWTDPYAQRIEVARLPGSSRKTLLWEGQVNDPHSIVLDPPNGHMYWSEWGASKSIKKSAMDGSNIKKLVATKGYATQLTLDYSERRLYWSEINSAEICSVDLNGNDGRVVVKEAKPMSLTLYKDFLYWSDNYTGELIRSNKFDGSNRQVIHKNSFNITDIQVYHSERYGSNHCATSNGGCKHLCLALPADLPEKGAKYTCACPTHYSLVGNECVPPENFMIYSQKNLTVRVLPSPAGCLEAVLPIQGLKWIKAIAFDPLEKNLYWIEGKTHLIKRADTTRTFITTVVCGSKELQPYDLAIDSLGRLLFWTSSQDVINVTRLDNGTPFGVVVKTEKERPRLIVIHETKRLLFYTDVGPSRQLVRTRLDGSHRLVITKDADIAAIAVDAENDWIVWSQGQSVYMSNIEGENQVVLVNDTTTKATQLTILSGWLYWIDREFQLQRVELQSGKQSSPLSLQASHVVDLISVSKPDQNHSCFHHNQRNCSHLCIMNGTSPVCACPQGNVLKENKQTCAALQKCGRDKFTCATIAGNHEVCIPISWKCDGERDCLDHSDELNCSKCSEDQFRCKDGSCISLRNACDGIPQCADQSDEETCCRDGFKCPNTHVCLSKNLVCDKVDHCADGADEDPSYCSSASKLKSTSSGLIWTVLGVSLGVLFAGTVFCCYVRKMRSNEDFRDQSEDDLSPMQPKPHIKMRKGIPDVVRMSMVTGSETSYDRNHITGASSSTNESSLTCYPREPLNPPPSPATTRGSSPSSRYRPYRHYRSINQPPPPTPCSTDVCDESDCNYPTRSRYDGGPFPPPPTPRSHCHSESCPPSPSSRSSTYFNPLPPPPSPVASPPRGYDS